MIVEQQITNLCKMFNTGLDLMEASKQSLEAIRLH